MIFLFRQAIGVVGGIVPWNYPFFIIARKVGPGARHRQYDCHQAEPLTPNCAAEFAKAVAEAELPPGVFNLVCGSAGSWSVALLRTQPSGW